MVLDIKNNIVYFNNLILFMISLVYKTPQWSVILKNKNIEGISFNSSVFDLFSYLFLIVYCCSENLPLFNYIDLIITNIINYVILAQFVMYAKNYFFKMFYLNISIAVLIGLIIFEIIPLEYYRFFNLFCLISYLISKIDQIYTNYKFKNTANLSIIVYKLSLFINLLKLINFFLLSANIDLIASYFIYVLLNIIIIIQINYYNSLKKN